jgi:hypothetical protein
MSYLSINSNTLNNIVDDTTLNGSININLTELNATTTGSFDTGLTGTSTDSFSPGLTSSFNTSLTGTSNGTFSTGITGTSTGSFNTNLTNSFYTSGILGDYTYIEKNFSIGRALLFRWIYDKYNGQYVIYEIDTINEKKRTLLHILGWPIANQTQETYTINTNNGFKFVHTNYQSQIINNSNITLYQSSKNYNYPTIKLNLNYFSNNYYFINNSYIYLKIYFDTHENTEKNYYYINALSDNNLKYNQVYVDDSYFNVGIGEDYNCIQNSSNLITYTKNQSYIFTKILLSSIPGNYDTLISNIINNNSYYINYDNVQDNIDFITIEVYDYNMKFLSISNDFSFTLNIHEIKDVLKETLINTKNNNVNTAGNFI